MSARSASPQLLAARTAVEHALDSAPQAGVVVACSGGADSLALAGATAWVAARTGVRAEAVVVDHGLQTGSDAVAQTAAQVCRDLGLSARVVRVFVGAEGGPEAAARTARYAALEEAADSCGGADVLLGHTREDQAETVLLRLARGSGARSLSAMAPRNGRWVRPFLDLPRADVRSAAAELLAPIGATPWDDPHNDDASFSRVRVRSLLGGLDEALGAGVVLGLARSAELLRDDADALEAIADEAYERLALVGGGVGDVGADHHADGYVSFDTEALAALPAAVRSRMIRRACLAGGASAAAVGFDHVRQIDDLVGRWRGQGEAALPGGIRVSRAYGRLWFRRSPTPLDGAPRGA